MTARYRPIIFDKTEYTTFHIIPERSIRNYNNLSIISALSSLYKSKRDRIIPETITKTIRIPGLGQLDLTIPKPVIHYVEPSRLWFEIIYTKDSVDFYLSVPSDWKNLIQQKINLAWEGSAIEPIDRVPIDINRPWSINYLRLKRNHILSIRTDRDDNDPLTDQLTLVDSLSTDDLARVLIVLEPSNFQDWIFECNETYRKIQEGILPKPRYELVENRQLLFWGALEFLLRNTADFIVGLISEGPTELSRPRDAQLDLIMKHGRLSNDTMYKMGSHPIKASILLMGSSSNTYNAYTSIKTLANSYSTLSADNELLPRDPSGPNTKILARINALKDLPARYSNILSDKEAAKLIQLPTAGLQDKYPITSISTKEVAIPNIFTDYKSGVPIGDYSYRGVHKTVYLPYKDPDELCLPSVVIAGMGQGKTQGFASNYAIEMFRRGFSVFAVDVAKGELMSQVTAVLRPEELKKVVYLDFSNPDYPIPLDWVEVKLYNKRVSSQRLTDELSHFLRDTSDPVGNRTRMYLELAAKTAFCIDESTLLDIILILKDATYRNTVLKKIKDPGLREQWNEWDTLTEAQQREFYRPILFRLNTIMGNDLLKSCICQPGKLDDSGLPIINFRKWMDEGYMVLIKASKSLLLEQGLNDFMSFLTAKVWLSALTRDEDKEYRPCIYILDEPQQYLSGSANHFSQMFTESRKWRLKLVFLFHSWIQLKQQDKDLARLLRSALCHWHVYSTSEEELKDMRPYIKPYTIDEAMSIKKHWAINHVRAGGDYYTFLAKMMKPPRDRLPHKDNSYLALKYSEEFGTPYNDVAEYIRSKERLLLSAQSDKRKR
jgi:hypothetical protein